MGGLNQRKFFSAKVQQPKGNEPKAPGTYVNFNDKLKFDASFNVDAPKIGGIDWGALFPQPEPE